MSNVVDITKSLARKNESTCEMIPAYDLGATGILMTPMETTEIIKEIAYEKIKSDQFDELIVVELIHLLEYVLSGYVQQRRIKSGVNVFNDSTTTPCLLSRCIRAFFVDMKSAEVPVQECMGISVHKVEFGTGFGVSTGITVDPERFVLSKDCEGIAHSIRHFARRMNELVRINKGSGILSEGNYFVSLPYDDNACLVITLNVTGGIKLTE